MKTRRIETQMVEDDYDVCLSTVKGQWQIVHPFEDKDHVCFHARKQTLCRFYLLFDAFNSNIYGS